MRKCLALVLLVSGCASLHTAPPVFAFHDNFWLNLHHFIRAAARGMPLSGDLDAPERAAWDEGVAFYRARYADRDVAFDDGMVAIKNALRAYEGKNSIADAPIDPELRAVLQRVAPVYRRVWWPEHQRMNEAWIDAARPLVRDYGEALSKRVAAAYGVAWPSQPHPVDLSIFAGPVGAYTTTRPPHTTIASSDPGYRGFARLEILFHEPSHPLAGLALQRSIAIATDAQKKSVPPQLWHAVLFYNAGELTRRVLAEHGVTYVELATERDLYKDLCGAGCRERVAAAWNRRLDGIATMDEALNALVTSWPE